MSNYFDGLIRASGLAAGSYPLPAAYHGITEIEAQHDAPPAAIPAATPASPAPAVAEAEETNARQTGIDAPPPVAAATPAQAMVHAALRWVTAEGQTPGAPTEIEIAPEQPPPSFARALTTHGTTPPAPDAATRPPEALTPLRVAPIRRPESIDQPPPMGERGAAPDHPQRDGGDLYRRDPFTCRCPATADGGAGARSDTAAAGRSPAASIRAHTARLAQALSMGLANLATIDERLPRRRGGRP